MPVLFDSFYAFAALVVAVVVYTRSHNMFMCEGVKSLEQQQHQPYLNNTQLLANNIVYLDALRCCLFFGKSQIFFCRFIRSVIFCSSRKVFMFIIWWSVSQSTLSCAHSVCLCATAMALLLTRALYLVHDPKLKFEPFPMNVFTAQQRKSGQYQ